MNKRVIGYIVGAIILIAGFFYFTQPAEIAEGTPSDHQYSQGSTGIVLMEYGDFQCSGCAAFYPVLKEVKEEYKETVTFQYRHLPLESIHVNARAAARASEAAAIQGKFWEMHDILFENITSWQNTNDPISTFTNYARTIGLETDKFVEDYKSDAVNAVINADLAEFRATGEPLSTPTFFLDGKKIEDAQISVEYFRALLDEAIAEKSNDNTADDDNGSSNSSNQ